MTFLMNPRCANHALLLASPKCPKITENSVMDGCNGFAQFAGCPFILKIHTIHTNHAKTNEKSSENGKIKILTENR
jgi:hypothetical protein